MTIRPRGEDEPLRIVCTDRGRHKRTQLADYWHGPAGDRLTSRPITTSVLSPADYEPEGPLSTVSRTSFTFYCARCGRNPKLKELPAEFAKAYDSAAIDCLDISWLDL